MEFTKPCTLPTDVGLAVRLRGCDLQGDGLDAIRGILIGTLVSLLGFWLPLAIAVGR